MIWCHQTAAQSDAIFATFENQESQLFFWATKNASLWEYKLNICICFNSSQHALHTRQTKLRIEVGKWRWRWRWWCWPIDWCSIALALGGIFQVGFHLKVFKLNFDRNSGKTLLALCAQSVQRLARSFYEICQNAKTMVHQSCHN